MRGSPGSCPKIIDSARLVIFSNILIALLVYDLAATGAFAGNLHSPNPAAESLDDIANTMYNAEYGKALSMLQEWLKAHPADVRAWNYRAEATLDQEMVKENLYSGAAFLRSGEIFKKRREPLPPSFEKRINAMLDHAQQLEEARLRRDPNDAEALYWLGVTHSTRTEFLFALERSYYAALREGKRAWNANERLKSIDPHCADADLVLGFANYAISQLPWYIRMITSVAGIHGNAQRGVQELKNASLHGRYTRADAKILLIMIYEREKKYSDALALLGILREKYPWNYLVAFEMARVDKARGDWSSAAAVYDAAVQQFVRSGENPSNAPRALLLVRAGEAHEHLGELDEASKLYHEGASIPDGGHAAYQAELAAGRLDQHFKRIDEARREYQHVADSSPDPKLASAAQRSLNKLQK